jgi:hypothetical protein
LQKIRNFRFCGFSKAFLQETVALLQPTFLEVSKLFSSLKTSCYFSFSLAPKMFFFSEIYRMMLADKRYGLSVNLIATKVLPLLIPQLVKR